MKKTDRLFVLFVLALCAAWISKTVFADEKLQSTNFTVTDLRCGGQVEPLGIDEPELLLGWKLEGGMRGLKQSAYRVMAASSQELLANGKADLWDSGKVDSDQSQWVKYSGKSLISAQRVFWSVQVWNAKGNSAMAKASWFETGLLNRSDKMAKWVEADPVVIEDSVVREWCAYLMLTKRLNRPDWNSFYQNRIMKMTQSNMVLLKNFDLDSVPSSVRLYAASRGFYTVYLNGQRVGDAEYESTFGLQPFDPLYHLDSPPLYRAYDVTSLLKQGKNELRVLLSRGRAGIAKHPHNYFILEAKPQLWLQLDATENGSRRTLAKTDTSWKQTPGALVKDSFLLGEICDGRIDPLRRDLPDVSNAWKPVKEFAGFPKNRVAAQSDVRWNYIPPERVISHVTPIAVFSPAKDVWVYDLGQFISGTIEWTEPLGTMPGEPTVFRLAQKLKRDGLNSPLDDRYYPPGTQVIDKDRMISQGNRFVGGWREDIDVFNQSHKDCPLGKEAYDPTAFIPTDIWLNSGKSGATWRGTSRIHSFRYVEIIGLKAQPSLDLLRGLFIHSDVECNGGFQSSNPTLNAFYERCTLVQMLNTHGFLTDCWDGEKSPWNESANGPAQSSYYSHDISGPLRKMSADNTVATLVNGKPGGFTTDAIWAFQPPKKPTWPQTSPIYESAVIKLPWYQYLYCGDLRSARSSYEAMMAWLRFYCPNNTKLPIYNEYMPDWVSYSHGKGQGKESGGRQQMVQQIALFYDTVGKAMLFAKQFGKCDDENWLKQLQETMRAEMMSNYWSAEKKTFGNDPKNHFGTDIEDGVVGATSLASPEIRNLLAQGITRQLRDRNYAPINGICTFAAMLDLMADCDQTDAIYRMFNREEYPSLKYMMAHHPDGFVEWFYAKDQWSGGSFVHHDFTQMSRWLFYGLGGLRPCEEYPAGFKHFDLAPQVPLELKSVSIWHRSPYGKIVSNWKKENGRLIWQVTVPPNSTATVRIPAISKDCVTESDQPIEKADGVEFVKMDADRVVCNVQSGNYRFGSVLPEKDKPSEDIAVKNK